jgi:hypothetical protein
MIFGRFPPGMEIPERSPFTSARKTGTPVRDRPSARTCSDTVLPVPVAPAIKPWRLAICGSRKTSCSPLATGIGSVMNGVLSMRRAARIPAALL